MFINASTKESTHVNNALPSYVIAFEHLLYKIDPSTMWRANIHVRLAHRPTEYSSLKYSSIITSKYNMCVSLIIMLPTPLHFCNLKCNFNCVLNSRQLMLIVLIDIKLMSQLPCLFYCVQFEWLPIFTKILTIFLKQWSHIPPQFINHSLSW